MNFRNPLYLIILLALSGFPAELFPQGRNLPVNLSLFYPLSINRSVDDNANLNLGLIGSHINNLKGAAVNTMFSINKGSVYGAQVNGFYSETRGKLYGIQFTGLVNTVTGGGWGIMAGGLTNMTFDDFRGLQFAGFANLCFENAIGMQIAGLYNLTGKDISLFQLAAAGNVTGKNMKGAQISAFFNLAGRENNGLQFSMINLTRNQRGAQFGLINVSDNNGGLQFGLLNVVGNQQKGATLGLFYIYKKTRVQLMLSGGSLAYATLGVRFKTNNIYSMIDFGAPVVKSKSEKSVLMTYRAGYSFDLKLLNLNTDLGFTNISSESNQVDDKPSKNQFGLSFRLGLEKNIWERLGVFVNAGYFRKADSYNQPKFKANLILEGGLVLL